MVKKQNRFERIMSVDSAWEQDAKRLEARKIPVNRAREASHTSGASFVRRVSI